MNIRLKENKLSDEDLKAFRKSIDKAFRILRKKGYFARQNFRCCQTCGWDAVPEAVAEKAVFYHKQDSRDIPYGQFYVSWEGNGNDICGAFWQAGLYTQWNGVEYRRILVLRSLSEVQ